MSGAAPDLFASLLGSLGPSVKRALRQGRAASKALSAQAANARQIAQAGLALADGVDQAVKGLDTIAEKLDAAMGTGTRREDPRVRVRPATPPRPAAAPAPVKARPRASAQEIVDAEVVHPEPPRKR
mgnify:FL=1